MSESRIQILEAIRAAHLEAVALPEVVQNGVTYDAPWHQFATVLETVGGRMVELPTDRSAGDFLAQDIPAWRDAARKCSLVEDVSGNVELAQIDDPHHLADLDAVVARGELAVAENAAVWVSDRHLRQRVVYFIARHLILLVPRRVIVHNMHQAYQRIAFGEPGFGVFVSGPSKTADIEQSLVIGAHGAKTLTVIAVPD